MAHTLTPVVFYQDPATKVRSVSGDESSGGSRPVDIVLTDIDYSRTTETTHTFDPNEVPAIIMTFFFDDGHTATLTCTEAEAIKVRGFFRGQVVNVDANGAIIADDTDTGDDTGDGGGDAPAELQLVQDPVIYNRPETGLSQLNVPFFKFHNPNGKSAITISMVDVDHTRFDSNSDDTHHYVVVTKARIEIRCLCTVNEQLGLEFRWRGTTHVISAEESNNVRLIAESRANPE